MSRSRRNGKESRTKVGRTMWEGERELERKVDFFPLSRGREGGGGGASGSGGGEEEPGVTVPAPVPAPVQLAVEC